MNQLNTSKIFIIAKNNIENKTCNSFNFYSNVRMYTSGFGGGVSLFFDSWENPERRAKIPKYA
jgi:hypothetical protein